MYDTYLPLKDGPGSGINQGLFPSSGSMVDSIDKVGTTDCRDNHGKTPAHNIAPSIHCETSFELPDIRRPIVRFLSEATGYHRDQHF